MATTPGNRTTQAYGVEPSANTEPSSTPATFYLSPNSFPTFGPYPERIARDPIGPENMALPGVYLRKQTRAGFDGDLNRDHWLAFLDGAMRSTWSSTGVRRYYPTEVRGTDYVVAANGAIAANTLVYARGFATSGNNGLKVVGAGSDATHIVASGLTAETLTAGQGPTVEVCGYQGASGTLQIDADGNLISVAGVDFTTLGLVVGQHIWIGGETSATSFATATHRGICRVTAIAAAKLTLDNKTSGTLASGAADAGAGKTIQIFYGRTIRGVATTDSNYAERTYHMEIGHGALNAGAAMYEYMTGCGVSNWRMALGTSTKGTIGVDFEAQGYVAPVAAGSRRSSFAAPLRQNASALLKTGSGIIRGRVQQSATALTGYITNVDLAINSGLNRFDAHGNDEAAFFTFGDLVVSASAQVAFSESSLMTALLSDTVCNADWFLRSTDGWGCVYDIPALHIASAPRSPSATGPTMAALELQAVRDTTYSTNLIVSDFPYVPAS